MIVRNTKKSSKGRENCLVPVCTSSLRLERLKNRWVSVNVACNRQR